MQRALLLAVSALLGLATLLGLAKLGSPRLAFAAEPPAGEWLMPRHDVRQSNFAPGTANMASPAVRWRIPLTGSLGQASAADVDLDGTEDLLIVVGGRLVAQSLSGKLLWQTKGLGLSGVAALGDLNGDGAQDVVVVAPTAVHVLQLASGAVWWSTPTGMYTAVSTAAVADFDGDGRLDLATANVGGFGAAVSATATVWRFVGQTAQVAATIDLPGPEGQFPFGSAQIPLDADGDGLADLLIYGAERLGAFSGKTGKPLGVTSKLPKLFLYQPVQSFLPAGAKAPLLVWPGNNPGGGGWQQQVGWYVLQLQDGALQVLWQELAQAPAEEASIVVPGSVADLDGDGLGELVASRFVAGKWTLRIFDLQSGELLTEADGAMLGASDPAQGPVLLAVFAAQAGGAGLVCKLETTRGGSADPPLRLVRWQRGKGLYDLTDAGKGAYSAANRMPQNDADSRWKQPLAPLLPLAMPPQGKAQPIGDELLWLRDLNGDGQADRLQRTRWQGNQLLTLAETPLGPAAQLPLTVATPLGRSAVVGQADGQVLELGADLQLQNDANGDGEADLVRQTMAALLLVAGRWQAGGPMALLVGAGPLLSAWDIANKDPANPPTRQWQVVPTGGIVTLNMLDLLGSGQRSALTGSVVSNKGVVLRRWDSGGALAESYSPPGPALRFAYSTTGLLHHDLDGDGGDELLLPMAPLLPEPLPLVTTTPLRWANKQLLWTKPEGCAAVQHYPLALDPTAQPPRVLQSVGYGRMACDALTGAVLAEAKGEPAVSGTPLLAAHAGPEPGDWTLAGSVNAVQLLSGATAQPLWTTPHSDATDATAGIAPLATGAVLVQLLPNKATVTARSLATGALLWSRVLTDGEAFAPEQAPSTTATVQRMVLVGAIVPGGGPVALVSNSQGWLHALDVASGKQVWAWPTDGAVGALAVADVDEDGALEVLVGLASGELVALDGNVAQPPQLVRDLDPALAEPTNAAGEDVDEQEEAEVFAASWPPVPGAGGYRARLLDATGTPVAPPVVVQTPYVRWQGLYLQTGNLYQASVQSFASVGKDASFSVETRSDGATVVDRSPPVWEQVQCVPACIVGLNQPLQVRATARDRTRLGRITASVATGSEPASVLLDKPWLAARYDLQLALPALPTGDHTVVLRAVDLAGASTEVSVALQICPVGLVGTASGCAAPVVPPKALGGDRVLRRGCSAGRLGGTAPAANVLWLALLPWLWVLVRRQRGRC